MTSRKLLEEALKVAAKCERAFEGHACVECYRRLSQGHARVCSVGSTIARLRAAIASYASDPSPESTILILADQMEDRGDARAQGIRAVLADPPDLAAIPHPDLPWHPRPDDVT